MGFMDKFRKKKPLDEEIDSSTSSSFGNDEDEEEEKDEEDGGFGEDDANPFFAGSHDINLEEAEDPNKRGRRLKGKAVVGVIGLVAAVALAAIVSNMLSPKVDLTKKGQEGQQPPRVATGNKQTNPTSQTLPGNYGELAKYRAEQERLAKERAAAIEATKREKEKKQQEQQQQGGKGQGNEFERKQNNGATPTPPSVPNVPNQPAGISPEEAAKKRAEEERSAKDFAAKRSALSFNVSGGGGAVNNFFNSNSGRIDTSTSYVIQAGTVVPATILNGLDTRMSGDVVAQIRQDVYDSQTGSHLLIPQGSKLLGSIAGGSGRRVGVNFNRIILPDGSNIALKQQRAVDKAGYGGLKDQYDTHEPDFYRSALISAVVGFLSDAVDEHFDRRNTRRNGNNGNEAAESAMTKVADNITNHIMQRAEKTESPNAIIRPGFQFNVFINEDFTAYEYLR